MDITEMLEDQSLLTGFVELLADTDPQVIKRTSRVAASIYYRSLHQMMLRTLDVDIVEQAWPIVLRLTHGLFDMVEKSENEGVTINLVHFVQEAVAAHLSNDVSGYPAVTKAGRDVIKRGLRVLKDLVTLPHVGGIVFITAIRALVSLACLRSDLHEPVTSLVRKHVAKPPATLFDHNVRSLHKMLQRNLMKILRISTDTQHKAALIELLVVVGVPRRYMAPWAPPGTGVKRSPVRDDSETPPAKRKVTEIPTERVTTEKQPLTGFALLTSLLPKPNVDKQQAEKTIASRLSLPNVCDIILANIEAVPDDMPGDFSQKFLSESVVGEIPLMRTRLASLLTHALTAEQLKSIVSGRPKSPAPVTPPKVETPPVPLASKDIDMRILPTSTVRHTPTPPSKSPPRDYDARMEKDNYRDPRMRTQSRDPRQRSNEDQGDPRASRPTSLLGDYKGTMQYPQTTDIYSKSRWGPPLSGRNAPLYSQNSLMR